MSVDCKIYYITMAEEMHTGCGKPHRQQIHCLTELIFVRSAFIPLFYKYKRKRIVKLSTVKYFTIDAHRVRLAVVSHPRRRFTIRYEMLV